MLLQRLFTHPILANHSFHIVTFRATLFTAIRTKNNLSKFLNKNNSYSYLIAHTSTISNLRLIGDIKSGASSGINSNKSEKQKDQFIHDHLNSSQDANLNENFSYEQEPPRERFGVLKALIIIVAGIYFGAWVAMIGAKILEDLDIFVQERDDNDD